MAWGHHTASSILVIIGSAKIYAYVYIHTYLIFNFDALALGNTYHPQRNRKIIVDLAGIELTTFKLRQYRQLPVVLPEAGCEAAWGSKFVPLKKSKVGSFTLLHKISRTACCFGIRTLLKQHDCYENATIWFTDHQYLAQYSEIINNRQGIPQVLQLCCALVRGLT